MPIWPMHFAYGICILAALDCVEYLEIQGSSGWSDHAGDCVPGLVTCGDAEGIWEPDAASWSATQAVETRVSAMAGVL